jgi:hypothetical protein
MSKTGRNEPCPCGSGLKYKKCCLPREAKPVVRVAPASRPTTFVDQELAKLRDLAAAGKRSLRVIGALLFFSTAKGDAWLLELVEQDALRVATGGEPVDVVVNETEETLEIGWTHHFSIEGQTFVTKAYLDDALKSFTGYPTLEIKDALEQIRRQYTREELASIRSGE